MEDTPKSVLSELAARLREAAEAVEQDGNPIETAAAWREVSLTLQWLIDNVFAKTGIQALNSYVQSQLQGLASAPGDEGRQQVLNAALLSEVLHSQLFLRRVELGRRGT